MTRTREQTWLDTGTETCELCGARYVLELEYRCTHCDMALCPFCAVAEYGSIEVYCRDCERRED